jgi:hypothetical protein
MRTLLRFGPGIVLVASLAALGFPGPAVATTQSLAVNVTSDTSTAPGDVGQCAVGGSCSLREAIHQANMDMGDSIVIGLGTYTLSSAAPLVITSNVAVRGASPVTTVINGGGSGGTQIIDVESPASVTLAGVTLTGGDSSGSGGAAIVNSGGSLTLAGDVVTGNTAASNGGGIEDEGTLAVQSSTISQNTAGSGGSGGGVDVLNSGTGAVTASVADSTLNNNGASSGGGLWVQNTSTGTTSAIVTGSTFTANSASFRGGGVAAQGPGQTLSISDSTITQNSSAALGGGVSGQSSSSLTLTNDTIDANSGTGGGNLNVNASASVSVGNSIVAGGTPSNCEVISPTDLGHNLDDASDCGFSTTNGDLLNANPDLGPLQNNGGPTSTMALQASSPAINAGDNSLCPSTDQRGVSRPQQGACDIGAYELAPPSLLGASASNVAQTGATLNAVGTNPDALAASVVFQYGTTTSYGGTATGSIAALSGATGVSANVANLAPNTTYHFRAIVANSDGSVVGPDQTFTTPAAPNSFTFGKIKVSGKGAISVPLKLPWSGKVSGKATFVVKTGKHKRTFVYGTANAKSNGAGTVTLKITVRGKAAKQLKQLGRARVTITVTFSPNGGSKRTKTVKVTVKRNKHGRYS